MNRDETPTVLPRRQRVLLVHRYFRPDVTTYGLMLEQFAMFLAERGHDVEIVCGKPSYNSAGNERAWHRRQREGRVSVRRFWTPGTRRTAQKLLDFSAFAVLAFGHATLRRRRFDVISVTTMPPIAMGLVGRAVRRLRGTRFVYHCMDLYPEAAGVLGGDMKSWRARLARRIDAGSIAAADQTIVLSGDMKQTLVERGCDERDVAVCNNFDTSLAAGDDATYEPSSPTFNMIFAGNLGRFQGLDDLITATEALAEGEPPVSLTLMGAGVLRDRLQQRAGASSARIAIVPHRSPDEARHVVAGADLAIVSLAPGMTRVAYPSKFITAMSTGTPVLAIVDEDSELARTVRSYDLGVVARPGDVPSIVAAIESARVADRPDRRQLRTIGGEMFGRDKVLHQWARLYGL